MAIQDSAAVSKQYYLPLHVQAAVCYSAVCPQCEETIPRTTWQIASFPSLFTDSYIYCPFWSHHLRFVHYGCCHVCRSCKLCCTKALSIVFSCQPSVNLHSYLLIFIWFQLKEKKWTHLDSTGFICWTVTLPSAVNVSVIDPVALRVCVCRWCLRPMLKVIVTTL